MDNEQKYNMFKVCRFINEPKRYLGCTKDEIIPAMLIMMMGVSTNILLFALIGSACWIGGVKYLKRRFGMAFLMVFWYWNTSKTLSRLAFKNTPPSENKYWI